MIYKLEKRHEFGSGTMSTHYEVVCYERRTPIGILVGAKTLKKGSLSQCEKYIRIRGLEVSNE